MCADGQRHGNGGGRSGKGVGRAEKREKEGKERREHRRGNDTAQHGGGRNHHAQAFTVWMAGGGVKGGTVYGATDDFGFKAVENRVHVHDLHATMLHLMGFDHERFTYRYAGRDFRLTDVYGRVIDGIVA